MTQIKRIMTDFSSLKVQSTELFVDLRMYCELEVKSTGIAFPNPSSLIINLMIWKSTN